MEKASSYKKQVKNPQKKQGVIRKKKQNTQKENVGANGMSDKPLICYTILKLVDNFQNGARNGWVLIEDTEDD